MAKKSEPVAPPPEPKRRGPRPKLCRELNNTDCDGEIWGRSTECPICHTPVMREAKEKKAKGATEPDQKSLRENATLKFVLRNGGFDKAKKLIAQLKENDCMDFAILCGGVQAAADLLEEAESSVHLG